MPLPPVDCLHIAARAARLDERLAMTVAPDGRARAAERLERWGRTLGLTSLDARAIGDHLGIDPDRILPALGSVSWPEEHPLPSWVRDLAALVESVEGRDPDVAAAGDRAERPFEHVLRPFVDEARRRLLRRVPAAALEQLSPAAMRDLADGLLDRLSAMWAPTLELELAIARASRRAAALGLTAAAGDARGEYRWFVGRLLREGLPRFFREYSVLGRRTVLVMARWIENTADLLLRLERDRPLYGELLSAPGATVARVTAGLSDPHDGGREVLALIFAGGGRLIYKPYDLAVDRAWADLLRWLSGRGLPLDIRTPRSVTCGTHGWVELVTPEPCPDEAGVARFYQRAGAQLALFHILGAVDCHHENLIAHGEHPVLCDIETIMHPRAAVAGMIGVTVMGRSVLDVGLLPVWAPPDGDGTAVDISGLGGGSEEDPPLLELAYEHVNTDMMVRCLRRVKVADAKNRPTLKGRGVSLAAHVEAIVEGYRATAALLVAERADLLAEDGPIAALARAGGRLVFRLTALYAQLVRRLLEPDQLREGIEASLALARLSAGATRSLAPLIREEQEALERLDIPRLSVGSLPADVCEASPFASCAETLSALDGGAIEQQINLIRAALASGRVVSAGEAAPAAQRSPEAPLTAALALAEARAIGAALATHAAKERDGSLSWMALTVGDAAQRLALRQVGIGLYEGTAGVALFLAALSRFGEVAEAAEVAARALRATLHVVARATASDAKLPAEGQPLGLGGVLYALTRCGEWLDRPEWLDDAVRAAGLVTAARIAGDSHLDVVNGVAGLIPGLLAVHRATGDRTALARAIDCGRHLLARQRPGARGGRAWATLGGAMLAGYSHGAAGISCQLVRLAEATGDASYLDGARDAIAYEQTLFDEGAQNWLDLRAPADAQPAFMLAWCNGAPGIALSRAACLASLRELDLMPQVMAGVTTTLRGGPGAADGLCCGNLGRADVLATLARRLGRPELLDAARAIAAAALARKAALGGWHPAPVVPRGIFHPSLFHGVAGIGHALLRLAMPEGMPSALEME